MDESAASPSHELEQLPGFRFHPTEEELLNFYLQRMVAGNKLHGDVIGFLNIYKYHPTDLPGLARINSEREWYFFVPRDRRHGGGGRPNRTTENGFWKATGSDKKIPSLSDPKRMLGAKKTLVFYEGRAPRGRKTDWVMNEYRLPEATVQEVVLCKVYRKATSLKVLEQRAAEEEARTCISPAPLMADTTSSFFDFDLDFEDVKLTGGDMLKFSMEWNQDALWSFENLTPFMPLC